MSPFVGRRFQTAIVIFSETCDVQPDAAPTLAVVRRGQQTIHHFCERVRRGIFLECGDLFVRGRKTGKIQRGTSQKIAPARGFYRLKPLFLETAEHKAVDRVFRPSFVFHVRWLRIFQCLERPEVFPFRWDDVCAFVIGNSHDGCVSLTPHRAVLDPRSENINFGILQFAAHRHLQSIGGAVLERLNHQAVFGVAGNNRGATLAALLH